MSRSIESLDETAYEDLLAPIWGFLARTDDPAPSDVIFVFGSRDLGVPRRAAELYAAGLASRVLVSGLAARGGSPAAFDRRCIPQGTALSHSLQGSNTAGILSPRALPGGRSTDLGATLDFHHGLQGPMFAPVFDKPEALVFKDALTRQGVPGSAITTEVRAGNTLENVRFGMAALAAAGQTPRSALLVAKAFVMRRCLATFARQHAEVDVRGCPPPGSLSDQRDRPLAAFAARLVVELDRIDKYGATGDIELQEIPNTVREAARVVTALGRPAS